MKSIQPRFKCMILLVLLAAAVKNQNQSPILDALQELKNATKPVSGPGRIVNFAGAAATRVTLRRGDNVKLAIPGISSENIGIEYNSKVYNKD